MPYRYGSITPIYCIVFHLWIHHNPLILPIVDTYLSYFQFGATLNNATTIVLEYGFWCTCSHFCWIDT